MLLISYGACAETNSKPGAHYLHAADIFEMLHLTMRMVNPRREHREVAVLTGLTVKVPESIWGRAMVVSRADNPGHQRGAAWNIVEAMRFAVDHRCDELVHLGGDIIPLSHRMVADELDLLRSTGADYIAGRWGDVGEGVGTQCFICRPAAFFGEDLRCRIHVGSVEPTLEYYMAGVIRQHGLRHVDHIMPYDHSHDLGMFRAQAARFLNSIGETI